MGGIGCRSLFGLFNQRVLSPFRLLFDSLFDSIARGTRQGHTIRQSGENRRKEKERQNASGGGTRRKGEGRKEKRKRRERGKSGIIGGNAGCTGIIDTNNA